MPDSQPNYLTVKPSTGEVGAEFSGAIESRGINFPFPDPSQFSGFIPPEYTVNRIQWTNPVAYTGVNGYIEVSNGGVGNFMNLYHIAGTSGLNARTAQLRMRTFLAGVADPDRNEVQIEGIVQDAALGLFQKRKIIDAHGVSDFVQKANVITGNITGFYSPWTNYGSPFLVQYNWYENGLFILRGLVAAPAPAYATQYVCTLPPPAPRATNSQRILFWGVGVSGSTYENMRFDVTPLTTAQAVLVFNYHLGVPDGSPVAWCPLNIVYHTDLPWGQAF